MPALIKTGQQQYPIILSAIEKIEELAKTNLNNEAALVTALTPLLTSIKPLFTEAGQKGGIDIETLEPLQTQLIQVLNPVQTVRPVSQMLWRILSAIAKIHPKNDMCCFDIETYSLKEDGSVRSNWIYTSSGHAFHLRQLIKFNKNGLIWNPITNQALNHHDQVIIKQRAAKEGVTILDGEKELEQLVKDLQRRYSQRHITLCMRSYTNLIQLLPSIKKELSGRQWYTGILPFMAMVMKDKSTWCSIATYCLLPAIAMRMAQQPTLHCLAMFLTALHTLTVAGLYRYRNELIKVVDLVSIAMIGAVINFTYPVLLLQHAFEPTAFTAMAKQYYPLTCVTCFTHAISRLLIKINEHLPIKRYIDSLECCNMYMAAVTIGVLQVKIKHELKVFEAKYPITRETRAIINAFFDLQKDMQNAFRSGTTTNIRSYMSQMSSAFWQQYMMPRQIQANTAQTSNSN